MYPVFLYNFIVRSFACVRVKNQKLEIEKVSKRETWSVELSSSGSTQMSPVRHGHRIRGWLD